MKNNLKNQIFWNTLGSGFHSFNSLFFLIIVTRINGIKSAGIFTLCFATASIFYTIAVYSGRTYQVSEREKQIDDKEFIFNRAFMSCLMIVIALIFGLTSKYVGVKLFVLLILCIVKLIEALSDVYHGILQKHNRLDIVGKSLLIRSLFDIILFVIMDLITNNIILSCLSLIMVSLLTLVLYDIPKTKLYKNETKKLNVKASFSIIKMGFFTFGFTFISNYLVNAPRYAIDNLLGEEFQTIFGIIVMPASIILLANQFALQPAITKLNDCYKQNDKRGFIRIIRILSLITIAVGLVATLAAYLIGIPVLNLLYGLTLNDYLTGLLIIICGATLSSLSCILSNALVILRKTKVEFSIYVISTIFALFLSGYLTKTYSFNGAVVSYLLIMTCLFVLSMIYFEFVARCKVRWK